jgi:hypothetical protein
MAQSDWLLTGQDFPVLPTGNTQFAFQSSLLLKVFVFAVFVQLCYIITVVTEAQNRPNCSRQDKSNDSMHNIVFS